MYLKELLEMLICTVSMDTLLYQQRIKLSVYLKRYKDFKIKKKKDTTANER